MNIAVILRSREMYDILKPFLAEHNVRHYSNKEDFLSWIKKSGDAKDSENLTLIVNAGIPIGEDVLSFPNIKIIQQFGIGYENVDINYASKKGVLVFNVPTAGTFNAVSVAELSLFFHFSLSKGLQRMRRFYKSRYCKSSYRRQYYQQEICNSRIGRYRAGINKDFKTF
jgi:Lactate dehydrogenase and related dehydrogenases